MGLKRIRSRYSGEGAKWRALRDAATLGGIGALAYLYNDNRHLKNKVKEYNYLKERIAMNPPVFKPIFKNPEWTKFGEGAMKSKEDNIASQSYYKRQTQDGKEVFVPYEKLPAFDKVITTGKALVNKDESFQFGKRRRRSHKKSRKSHKKSHKKSQKKSRKTRRRRSHRKH